MLALAGELPDAAFRAALRAGASAPSRFSAALAALADFPAAAARHPEAVREALHDPDAKQVASALEMLARHGVDLAPHVDRLADLAASSARPLRSRALAVLRAFPDAADAPLRSIAAVGSPGQRLHAVEALRQIRGEESRAFIAGRLAVDGTPRVRKAIARMLSAPVGPSAGTTDENAAFVEPALALAPIRDRGPGPLPPGARDALRRLADAWYRDASAPARRRSQDPLPEADGLEPVTDARIDAMVAVLEAGRPEAAAVAASKADHPWPLGEDDAKAFLSHPGIGLVHAVRFLSLAGFAEPWKRGIRVGVLAVAGACAGADAAGLVRRYLDTWGGRRAARCKALLRMLSWVDHPAAVRTLLDAAATFPTAGIRDEADACSRAVAARKECTLVEMADRAVLREGPDGDGPAEASMPGWAST